MNTLESLRLGDSREFGIEVTHKYGGKDWYDPLREENISENETYFFFDNGRVYKEPKDNVIELTRYEICQNCHRTLERCECHEDDDNGDRDPHDGDEGGFGISRVPDA